MAAVDLIREPYQISLRLYRSLQDKTLALDAGALQDELTAAFLETPDQLRRHRLLIQAQRDEADRLRDFLTTVTVRPAPPQNH